MGELRFAVVAEKKGFDQSLFLHDLTIAGLYADVVVPYEENAPFFIDGVPVTKGDLARIKIIRQHQSFMGEFEDLHQNVRFLSRDSSHFVPIADYPGRLLALFREAGTDVTSNIINAFREKKALKIPADKIIEAASQVVVAFLTRDGS